MTSNGSCEPTPSCLRHTEAVSLSSEFPSGSRAYPQHPSVQRKAIFHLGAVLVTAGFFFPQPNETSSLI